MLFSESVSKPKSKIEDVKSVKPQISKPKVEPAAVSSYFDYDKLTEIIATGLKSPARFKPSSYSMSMEPPSLTNPSSSTMPMKLPSKLSIPAVHPTMPQAPSSSATVPSPDLGPPLYTLIPGQFKYV